MTKWVSALMNRRVKPIVAWRAVRRLLAVQLLRGAEVLLLDEPTAGLDWSVRSDVLKLLSNLAQEQVLIVVTHEPELFNRWDSDRLRLDNGQLTSMTTLIRDF